MVKNAGGFEAFLNSHANVWDKLPEFIRLPQHPSLYFTVERTISYMTAMWNSKPTPKKSSLDAVFEEYDGFTHEWRFWI